MFLIFLMIVWVVLTLKPGLEIEDKKLYLFYWWGHCRRYIRLY